MAINTIVTYLLNNLLFIPSFTYKNYNTMTTEITNLLTGEKTIFVNEYSLTHNIISALIIRDKRTVQILDNATRQTYLIYGSDIVESTSTITGRKFAYDKINDLHAKFI